MKSINGGVEISNNGGEMAAIEISIGENNEERKKIINRK
jgi:hypothetical protein